MKDDPILDKYSEKDDDGKSAWILYCRDFMKTCRARTSEVSRRIDTFIDLGAATTTNHHLALC